ncbi:MAG: hypothetical protein HY828_02360 [Actinobacteria bacterium]|nr:hypothetical protein [Actinomycetota bacterium]
MNVHSSTGTTSSLDESLAAWHAAGLIDSDQVHAISAFERASNSAHTPRPTPVARRRVPLVAEALGYLGGMLGVVGLVLLAARSWPDLDTAGRLLVTSGATVALTIAGMVVPHRDEPALERLRWFVWGGATAIGALMGGVFAVEVLDANWPPSVVLSGALVATALSVVLWWQRERPVQQLTFLIGALVVAGTSVAQLDVAGLAGLAVWAAAVVMVRAGLLQRTTFPAMTLGVGAAGMVVGAGLATERDVGLGLLFATLTIATLLTIAGSARPTQRRVDRVVLTVVGAMGLLQTLPQTVVWFGRDAGLVTGLIVFAVGVALVVAAGRDLVVAPVVTQLAGGTLLVAGTAVIGMQSVAIATTTGLVVAVGLLAVGTVPEHALLTIFGCLGLLINVPWAISHFFPGEGRAPLLIAVSGVLIVLVAVWLAHQGGELRHQFRRHRPTLH